MAAIQPTQKKDYQNMKTINRGTLRKLVEAGGVVMVGSYHFDDMHGGDRSKHDNMPVAIMPEDRSQRKEGICYLFNSDFSTGSGMAYENDNGTIHLTVHGNCNYDLKLREGFSLKARTATPKAQRPENAKMQAFLKANGIEATPKYIPDGSMRGTWRLYNSVQKWIEELRFKLIALGFLGYDGEEINRYAGNGGTFQVFVRGHNEFLTQ